MNVHTRIYRFHQVERGRPDPGLHEGDPDGRGCRDRVARSPETVEMERDRLANELLHLFARAADDDVGAGAGAGA